MACLLHGWYHFALPLVICECVFFSQPHQDKLLFNYRMYSHLMGDKRSLSIVWIHISSGYLSFPSVTAQSKFLSSLLALQLVSLLTKGMTQTFVPEASEPLVALPLSGQGCLIAPAVSLLSTKAPRGILEDSELQTFSFYHFRVSATLPLHENQGWLYPPAIVSPFFLLNHWYKDPKATRWWL